MLERKPEQPPPALHAQILPQLPAPHMELLAMRLLAHPVLMERLAQQAQRSRQMHAALGLNEHLAAERGAQLQLHTTAAAAAAAAAGGRAAVVVCFGGHAHRTGEGEVVGEGAAVAAAAGGRGGSLGLVRGGGVEGGAA